MWRVSFAVAPNVQAPRPIRRSPRLRACKELGLTPRTREWEGHGSPLEFVISANLRRRHLKENQRAMIAARMLPHYEAEAQRRMHHCEEGGPRANLPQGRARDFAGDSLSVSGRSVDAARKLLDHGIPALIARVDAGELAVSLAAKVAELPADEQAGFLDLTRAEIVTTLRMWQGLPLKPVPKPAAPSDEPQTAAQLQEQQKIARMIQNTQLGPGTQLLNTPQGLRLELTYNDCLTEFYHLNSDRSHLLDLLDRGVFIVRRKNQAS